jgi:hypothetical protein
MRLGATTALLTITIGDGHSLSITLNPVVATQFNFESTMTG